MEAGGNIDPASVLCLSESIFSLSVYPIPVFAIRETREYQDQLPITFASAGIVPDTFQVEAQRRGGLACSGGGMGNIAFSAIAALAWIAMAATGNQAFAAAAYAEPAGVYPHESRPVYGPR